MYKRYFSFGCSYVRFRWLTVSDLIGANFPFNFYNYGRPGGSNEHSCDMLFRANYHYNFNPETDFVTIGVTRPCRKTFVHRDPETGDLGWLTSGDTLPYSDQYAYREKIWGAVFDSYEYGLSRTVESLLKMKTLLNTLGIKHEIYQTISPGIPASYFSSREVRELYQQLNSFYTVKQTIDEHWATIDAPLSTTYNNGIVCGHPSVDVHYSYLKTHFPQYDTRETQKIIERFGKIDLTSEPVQERNFDIEYRNKYAPNPMGYHNIINDTSDYFD